MKELIKRYAKGTILSGIIIIGLVIYLEHILKHSYGASDNIPTAWQLGLKFGDHLGISFLSIGIIGLLFEAREWREKFHQEIERVVTSVDYFINLDVSKLEEAERIIHDAMRHKNLAKEGGLLYFEITKIKNYVESPYREGTRGVTIVKYDSKDGLFVVEETISYTCRKFGKKIQDQVEWTTRPGEIKEINVFQITATVPRRLSDSPKFAENYPKIKEPIMRFNITDQKTKHLLKPIKEGLGYTLSLDSYRDIEGLEIETAVTYVVPTDAAFSWTMPFPSDSLSGEIRFPTDLKIYIDPFVMESTAFDCNPVKIENGLEVYKYEYPTWLLPGDGFAFHFRKIRSGHAQTESETAAAGPAANKAK